MAPDHGNVKPESPATTLPSTRNAPCKADSAAVEAPPRISSVVTCHPAPKLASTPVLEVGYQCRRWRGLCGRLYCLDAAFHTKTVLPDGSDPGAGGNVDFQVACYQHEIGDAPGLDASALFEAECRGPFGFPMPLEKTLTAVRHPRMISS